MHTFDKLLPSSIYGKEHPEYYSYFKGKRHPGKASQWCLSNPEVFEIVAQRVDSIFKANPDKHIMSVSQMMVIIQIVRVMLVRQLMIMKEHYQEVSSLF